MVNFFNLYCFPGTQASGKIQHCQKCHKIENILRLEIKYCYLFPLKFAVPLIEYCGEGKNSPFPLVLLVCWIIKLTWNKLTKKTKFHFVLIRTPHMWERKGPFIQHRFRDRKWKWTTYDILSWGWGKSPWAFRGEEGLKKRACKGDW